SGRSARLVSVGRKTTCSSCSGRGSAGVFSDQSVIVRSSRLKAVSVHGASSSYNEVIPPPLPPPTATLTQGRRVDSSLKRLERAHDDLFQL
ncbi:uncharacterized protein LOC114357467, partial [Ostrinia furnacalis]|uniref:uncharacterized protein LOC114357467 n=1 Tax=Ostrinia furnacalis TaxID=93504 RepID=UPI001040651A